MSYIGKRYRTLLYVRIDNWKLSCLKIGNWAV